LQKERRKEEFKLQVAVVKHLRTAFPQLLFTHPAQKAKDKQEGYFNKMLGVRAGTPDLLLWWESVGLCRSGAIELKAKDGVASDRQEVFESMFVAMGGKHAYCTSVKGVHDTLLGWGLKPMHGVAFEPDLRTDQEKRTDAFNFYAPR
jgi:hypothetical protein